MHDDPDPQTRVSGLISGSGGSVLPAEETPVRSQGRFAEPGSRESSHELGAARLLHTARKHTGDRAENRRLSVRHSARSTSSEWPPVRYPTPGKTPLSYLPPLTDSGAPCGTAHCCRDQYLYPARCPGSSPSVLHHILLNATEHFLYQTTLQSDLLDILNQFLK